MLQLNWSLATFLAICVWMAANSYALPAHNTHNAPESRIVGGKPVYPQQIPYYVRVGVKYPELDLGSMCGGSLISNRHIVTAGHCFSSMNYTGVLERLEFGAHKNSKEEDEKFVLETADATFTVHPLHDLRVRAHDIAIVTLSRPVDINSAYIGTIGLPDPQQARRNYDGETVQAYGWGYVNDNPLTEAKELMGVNLTVISQSSCIEQMRNISPNNVRLYDYEVCTSGTDSSRRATSVCHGDSGGPLVHNGRLIGVASRLVIGYCTRGEPNVFVSVDDHLGWIRQQMRLS